jgi:hypothetical protein
VARDVRLRRFRTAVPPPSHRGRGLAPRDHAGPGLPIISLLVTGPPITGPPMTGLPFTGLPFTGLPFTGLPFTGLPTTRVP